MTRKNKETLDSFIKYCKEHPQERFWQALRNWSGYSFIYGSPPNEFNGNPSGIEDTFFKEGK